MIDFLKDTIKTGITEPPFFRVRLAKVLKLLSFDRTICPNFGSGEGLCVQIMVRNHFW